MSTMLFGLETWGRVGAAAIVHRHAQSARPSLTRIVSAALADVRVAIESNRRAFSACYQGRYDDRIRRFDDPDLRRIVGEELCFLAVGGKEPTRQWADVGGGIGYNCAEDPQLRKVRPVLDRLDVALDGGARVKALRPEGLEEL